MRESSSFTAHHARHCPPPARVQNYAMITRLTYTSLSLRRDGMSRRSETWVAEKSTNGLRAVPVLGSKSLIRPGPPPTAAIFEGDEAAFLILSGGQNVLLGTDGHRPVFAVAISDDQAPEWAARGAGEFIDIRQCGAMMPATEAHLLAHARGMVHWHSRHGYCGVCGAPTLSKHNGHERQCANADCATSHFPRTDPAIIVLVYRDDVPGGACLMGRNPRFPVAMYSTLAGFLEPGETLEQCVEREVFEESGIECTDVQYLASQPWPFPSSLMLGFHARATSYDISFDTEELADCRWFSRDEILGMKEWLDADEGQLRLPRRDSIARWLIQEWLDGNV